MIKWGIIGAGNIAHRFAKSLSFESDAELYGISGRNEEKLKAFQKEYPCEKIYIGHENLLQDENINAVYISLPHDLHSEWIIKALRAHKAVLCEKPAVMNAAEMEEVIRVAGEEHVLFMEAMKTRFVPAYAEIKRMIDEGVIGEVYSVRASNCFLLPEEMYGKTYHTKKGVGGALLDSGCYGVTWISQYMKGSPESLGPGVKMMNGVDMFSDTFLRFENGLAELIAGFDRDTGSHVLITGTCGNIVCDEMHRPVDFTVIKGSEETKYSYPYVHDDFFGEIHAFDELLKAGKTESDVMSLNDSLRDAEIMDLIRSGFPS